MLVKGNAVEDCSRGVFGLDDERLIFNKASLLICPPFEPLELCPTAPQRSQSASRSSEASCLCMLCTEIFGAEEVTL